MTWEVIDATLWPWGDAALAEELQHAEDLECYAMPEIGPDVFELVVPLARHAGAARCSVIVRRQAAA
jgi:hypothetical protein